MSFKRRLLMGGAEATGMLLAFATIVVVALVPYQLIIMYTSYPPTSWWVVLAILAHLHNHKRGEMSMKKRVVGVLGIALLAFWTGIQYGRWPPTDTVTGVVGALI